MAHGGATSKQFWLSVASFWLTAGQGPDLAQLKTQIPDGFTEQE
jgi:hypothetical protein